MLSGLEGQGNIGKPLAHGRRAQGGGDRSDAESASTHGPERQRHHHQRPTICVGRGAGGQDPGAPGSAAACRSARWRAQLGAVLQPHRQIAAAADVERARRVPEFGSSGTTATPCSGGEVRLRVCLRKLSFIGPSGLGRGRTGAGRATERARGYGTGCRGAPGPRSPRDRDFAPALLGDARFGEVTRPRAPRRPGRNARRLHPAVNPGYALLRAGPEEQGRCDEEAEAGRPRGADRGGAARRRRRAPIPPPCPARCRRSSIDPRAEADLFAMPRHRRRRPAPPLELAEAGRSRRRPPRLLDAPVAAHPGLGGLRADRAALAMLAGDARTALARARGRRRARLRRARRWPPTRSSPRSPPTRRFAGARRAAPARRRRPPAPVPAPVDGGAALVSGANTAWDPAAERLVAALRLPRRAPTRRCCRRGRRIAAYDLLREHWRARPRRRQLGRSLRQPRPRPLGARPRGASRSSTPVRYAPAARAADLDYGLQRPAPLRPPDLRQLLDRGDRRARSGAACRGSP